MNNHLREMLRKRGMKQWQVAEMLGVSERTLIVWLRKPLSPERECRILDAVERLCERVRV